MQKVKKKVRCRIRWKVLFLFFIFLFLGLFSFYYVTNLKIKNILIIGNELLTDNDIILAANIKNYPKMFKYSARTLKKNIATLDLVDKVQVKKNLLGKLTIEIEEAKVLSESK